MRRAGRRRAGVSLVEVVVSTFIIGVLMIAALRSLGASVRSSHRLVRSTKSNQLAHDLLSEILELSYEDPDGSATFGREADESLIVIRAELDDVDDFQPWIENPPVDGEGNALTGFDNSWQREVTVVYADPEDLTARLDSDSGIKRIDVIIKYKGTQIAKATGFQTKAWIDMIPEVGNHETAGSLPPGNSSPIAVVESSSVSGQGELTVQLDSKQSYDPDDDYLSYEWDFGDGVTSTSENPSHRFVNSTTQDIVFNVQLTVTDPSGAEDTASIAITVFKP